MIIGSDTSLLPHWLYPKLNDVGRLYCGQSPALDETNKEGRGIPYVTGPEQWDGHELQVNKWTEHAKKKVPPGCIFITVKGAGVGKIFSGIEAAIGRDIYAFHPHAELDYNYVFYAIKFNIDQIIIRAQGDIPGLSKAHILNHKIRLPGIQQQRRIVAKIEELFSELNRGVESLKTAREQLKVYRQAVLKHAFEGKLTADWREGRSGYSWKPTTLGAQLEYLTSGSRGWAKYYARHGDIFIRAQNLKFDRLDLSDVALVKLPEQSEGMRTRVKAGDLLVTITGANVTKTAFVNSDIGTAYVSQHVAVARPIKGALTEFLYWLLIADGAGRKQLNALAYGAGKPGLNLDNIRSVKIDLPEFAEQVEIVSRVKALLSVEESARAMIDGEVTKSGALRQSILKKAFSGQLVPQDPNDEPASALLERIRAERDARSKPERERKARAPA